MFWTPWPTGLLEVPDTVCTAIKALRIHGYRKKPAELILESLESLLNDCCVLVGVVLETDMVAKLIFI